jgi:hypothetical protein
MRPLKTRYWAGRVSEVELVGDGQGATYMPYEGQVFEV